MQKLISLVLSAASFLNSVTASAVVVSTSSGELHGIEQNGVMSFKGVRIAQPPTGPLRWAPPVAFTSQEPKNATTLGPACIQQFSFADSAFQQELFNTPHPAAEDEDCLFLNVWAPSHSHGEDVLKAVVVWIFGGGLKFGTASLPSYDGASLAANQDLVVVTINYRTNIFGFPSSPDLPLEENNLGFLDQDMALNWVAANAEQFGGDPGRVTLMGQSAGSTSISWAIARNSQPDTFHAAVLLSGSPVSSPTTPSFDAFNAFAAAFGCAQAPGPARIKCLKSVPAQDIREWTNGPMGGDFRPVTDNITVFPSTLDRIRSGAAALIPILIGNLENDGSVAAVGQNNLTAFLEINIPGLAGNESELAEVTQVVRSLYPQAQNESQVIEDAVTDFGFRCPAELWSAAMLEAEVTSVFRYTYGAVFADLQLFPNAGAWHSSEIGPLFGTLNRTTATPAELIWSNTFQTAIANFIKDPISSPALNWPKYAPGPPAETYAKLAYEGNVESGNFVQAVASGNLDTACDKLWNELLVK
ncbi:Carboxylesterase [Roridomyces roridus]|uniref:Carboxylic ester hydrolase n=1 Tax=Roridomyces roridus TaxID=1738132 RepID=A0AAD7BMU7_9AGAR|nr:Carboxylesterase [Roridomyces roridus]